VKVPGVFCRIGCVGIEIRLRFTLMLTSLASHVCSCWALFALVLVLGVGCEGSTPPGGANDGAVDSANGADAGARDASLPDADPPLPLDVRAAQVLEARCASSGCHGRVCASAGLGLDHHRVLDSVVGVVSSQDPRVRVAPGDLGASYLWAKITGEGITGEMMPPGGIGLPEDERATIREWIEAGASLENVGAIAAHTSSSGGGHMAGEPITGAGCSGPGALVVPPLAADEMAIEMAPRVLAPGEEVDLCTTVRVEGDGARFIQSLRTYVSEGSHHTAILGAVDTDFIGTRECEIGDFYEALPFYIAQSRDVSLELPAGHGLRVEPGSVVAMWAHFDNVGPCPIEASAVGVIEFEEEVAIAQEVSNFNMEKWDLAIPRRERDAPEVACSPEEWHLEEHTCILPDDIPYAELIALAPHFHAAGRRFEVRIFDGERVLPDPILTNDDWQHAQLTTLFGPDEAIRLEPGQGLNVRCYYYYECAEHLDNTPATSCPDILRGAPDAASEMCSLKTWYRGPVVRDIASDEPRCF